jgi:hypothetical protein
MDIIISQPWGGLGDNLGFSTLPELFHNKGYQVYISKNNVYRNDEIYDLVWKLNPYIKGISENTRNAGDCMQHNWPDESENEYMIHRIEIAHGLPKSNFYPKIYYEPKILDEYNNDILIDLSGSSSVYPLHKYIEYIDYFLPLVENQKDKFIKIVTFEKINIPVIFDEVYKYLQEKIPNVGYLKIKSLFHYCDVLKNCDTIIIVNSGVNSLVSAIKKEEPKPNVLCYNPWESYTPQKIKGFYNYKNINYFQSKIA